MAGRAAEVEQATGGDRTAYVQRGAPTMVAVFAAVTVLLLALTLAAAHRGAVARAALLGVVTLGFGGASWLLWQRRTQVQLAIGPLGVYLADTPETPDVGTFVAWSDITAVELFRRLTHDGNDIRRSRRFGVILDERAGAVRAQQRSEGQDAALALTPDPVRALLSDELTRLRQTAAGQDLGPSVEVDPLAFRRRACEDAVGRYAPRVPFRHGREEGPGPELRLSDVRRIVRSVRNLSREDRPTQH